MKKLHKSLLATLLAVSSVCVSVAAKADSVKTKCDVFPKGEDKAISSGACNFSETKGNVVIEISNGDSFKLEEYADDPGNYQDQNGNLVSSEKMKDKGIMFRLSDVSVLVYMDSSTMKK